MFILFLFRELIQHKQYPFLHEGPYNLGVAFNSKYCASGGIGLELTISSVQNPMGCCLSKIIQHKVYAWHAVSSYTDCFMYRAHITDMLTSTTFPQWCTNTIVYSRRPHNVNSFGELKYRCGCQGSLRGFFPLVKFSARNDDCRNGNVYFTIGRRTRFQSICKIMYSPWLHLLLQD